MKIAVYTAICGKHGRYTPLIVPTDLKGYDFIPFFNNEGRLGARKIKMLPHKYLPQYDVSMWIDGAAGIAGNAAEIIKNILKQAKGDFIVCTHPGRFNGDTKPVTIYEEAQRCIKFHRGNPTLINEQVFSYKKERCPANRQIVATTSIIRRHNEKRVIEFDELWWAEIQKYSLRDQISFAYLAWKYKFKYEEMINANSGLHGDVRSKWGFHSG